VTRLALVEDDLAAERARVNGTSPTLPVAGAGFVPAQTAQQVRRDHHFAVGGELLYAWGDGAYRPGGEGRLRRVLTERLGDSWRKGRADEVVAHIRASSPALWDQPPRDRVNVRNGILHIASGELEPHSPDWLAPSQLGAHFDLAATCPVIDRFLGEILEVEVVPVLLEVLGYLLTPDNTLQRAFMLIGAGGGGKSVTLNLTRALLGPGNVSSVALHQLEDDRFATADLYGCLLNAFADLDSRALSASSIFKSITGGDPVRAQRKNRDAFSFVPYARLMYSANEAPPTTDHSDAFFDRWLVIPFGRRFRGTPQCDPHLLSKLTTQRELSGLLNRALVGLVRLRAQGAFSTPKQTDVAADRFRKDSDSIAGFLDEWCELHPDQRTAKPDLYRAYQRWCDQSNRRPLAAQRTTPRIRELTHGNVDEVSSQGADYWVGIGLKDAT